MTAGGDLISCLDAAQPRPRYWVAFTLVVLLLVFELFDFFVVGYLVSAIAPLWRLNFGQTTVMLLGAGLGALLGAIVFGWLADRIGRKPVIVVSSLLCCVCAGSTAFVSDGSWMVFAALRFLVGVGYGGAGASQFALIVEYTPVARRTLLTSSMGIPAGVGLLLASLVVTLLFPALGWRGTAALGFAPVIVVLLIMFMVPESPKWLIAAGRVAEARRVATALLRFPSGAAGGTDLPSRRTGVGGSVLEVYSQPRRFWLIVLIQLGLGTALSGVLLWGPTILAQLLHVTAQRAAGLFVFVSLSAIAGRVVFTVLPQWFGRVPSGQLVGYMGAVMLASAAMFRDQYLAGVSLFFVFLLLGQFFYDGGYSNLNTYAAELFPVRLGARAMGVSASAAGIGKIMGPLALGIIAGTHNLVTPKATQAAVQPAFLFLAACCLVVGLCYSFLGVETHRKSLRLA
jgi:MFS transporter, putative metabolite:H+ symporter